MVSRDCSDVSTATAWSRCALENGCFRSGTKASSPQRSLYLAQMPLSTPRVSAKSGKNLPRPVAAHEPFVQSIGFAEVERLQLKYLPGAEQTGLAAE